MEFAVSRNRWSLRLVGIWPNPDPLSDLRLLITFTLLTSVIIPQLVDLYQNGTIIDKLIENLSSLVPVILVTIKIIIMRKNIRKLRECLTGMAEDWIQDWEPEFSNQFHSVMRRKAKIGRTFNMVCNILLWVTAIGFLSLPYTAPGPGIELPREGNATDSVSVHTRLPLSTAYIFNAYRSPIFELTYFEQCFTILIAATANFSIDSFLALLVLHFCGQLEILGTILEHYRGVIKHEEGGKFYSGSCSCINCIVEAHLRIMRFSGILDDSFHVMLLAELFLNSLVFCLLGYQIITNFEDSETMGMTTFFVFMLAMMFHLFLYSYVGEEIMEKSQAINYSAYKAAWYNLETKSSKPLIMLMARSKTPLRITAGKFFVMSLENYTSILKTSATYLSVLRAVKK